MEQDDWQKREFEQQQLVERIFLCLQHATRSESDDEYRQTFHTIGRDIYDALGNPDMLRRVRGAPRHFPDLVWPAISEFTLNPNEQRFLLVKVFEKILTSISAGIVSKYHREELSTNMRAVAG